MLALSCSFLDLAGNRIRLTSTHILATLVYVTLGLVFASYGTIRSNPGAISTLTVMVAYPLLFPILTLNYEFDDGKRLFRIFLISSCLIIGLNGAYIISYLLYPGNFFESFVQDLYFDNAVVDSNEDYFKFTIPNISSVGFLLPFVLSAFLNEERTKDRIMLCIILFFLLMLSILSGRRALMLAAFSGPIIAAIAHHIFRNKSSPKGNRITFGLAFIILTIFASIVALSAYFDLIDFYLEQAASIFDFDSNASNIERSAQFRVLVDAIAQAPLFGYGAGAAANFTRSTEQPWAYELSYLALVFQYGVVGFLIYLSGVIFLLFNLLKISLDRGRASFEYYFLSGSISFFIINGTNPYLAKFDYMWIIFIPLAIASFRQHGPRGFRFE
jgi:O-antigen ligase